MVGDARKKRAIRAKGFNKDRDDTSGDLPNRCGNSDQNSLAIEDDNS
jgi:hypothetical protein